MQNYVVTQLGCGGHRGHMWTLQKVRHEQMNAELDFEAEQDFIVQE